ncbi:DoxX family protein [Mesorhizobium sp. VNQ89]|uniref:DoxX family protein n=1 Tax=Mesorhizobium quangtriensis TaxID=3157709 RepID=UPI0032B83D57
MSERLSAYQPHARALLRIVAGLLFVHSALVLLFNIPPSIYPEPPPETATTLVIGGVLELVGGILLILGWLTRPAAFVMSGMMAVAYFMFHAPESLWPSNNNGGAAILFCFIFLYLVFAGPGAWALDNRRGD